jgi:hypothetical protein
VRVRNGRSVTPFFGLSDQLPRRTFPGIVAALTGLGFQEFTPEGFPTDFQCL